MNPTQPAALLEAKRLSKSYAGLPAVDGVSFSIRPGEILGYLGPNGSGKSTIVKMLAGLLEPSSGFKSGRARELLWTSYPANWRFDAPPLTGTPFQAHTSVDI
jgi:ABC-type branched-subunit amino acid transport system ATPase component